MLLQLLLVGFYGHSSAVKCYSCSSAQLHSRWPKDEDTNRLQYIMDIPIYTNESCDSVRSAIPVVDCPNSVCIKAVIKEPPAKRDVCVVGGAVIRDCWSRVMSHGGMLNPQAPNNIIRMAESSDSPVTVGYIYTCKGYLCNSSQLPQFLLTLIVILIF